MKKKIIPFLFSLFLLASCGADNGPEETKCEKHDFGKWETITEATCAADGLKERVCKVCGEKESQPIAKSDSKHNYGEWTVTKTATCGIEGSRSRTCSTCNKVDVEVIPATGHTFGDTPVFEVAKDHDLTGYKVYDCTIDHAKRIVWSAGDVTPGCAKGYDYNGKHEANIAASGEGWQFFGRPQGNGVTLDNSGNASQNSHTPVWDESVEGSYFEFRIISSSAIEGAQLMAELSSATYLDSNGGLFKGVGPDGDWTPGMIKDEEAEEGYKYAPWRYSISVNGIIAEMDDAKNIAGGDSFERGWYDFPCKIDLDEGENVIKIVMTGGWKHTFYNFGIATATAVELTAPAASQGFEVTFVATDPHVKGFTVYEDQKCTTVVTGSKYYSRNEYGRLMNDGDTSQISFMVEVDEGYKPDVTATKGKYKNIKDPVGTGMENVFRITKVNGEMTVTITAVSEEAEPDAWKIRFVTNNCTIKVVYGEEAPFTEDTQLSSDGRYFTRITAGTPGKQEKTKIRFIVTPNNGYTFNLETGVSVVASVAEKGYNKIEEEDGVVGVTKISDDLTITVTCVAIG